MDYKKTIELNTLIEPVIKMIVEIAAFIAKTNTIEQILIQSTSTFPDKGTLRNERPKTISDNATVESQIQGS